MTFRLTVSKKIQHFEKYWKERNKTLKTEEAKQYLQAVKDSLEHLTVQASIDNVGYLAGAFQILTEVQKNIDTLEKTQEK